MTFDVVATLMGFALLGAQWILWLLLLLSVLSLAIIIERGLFYWRMRSDFSLLSQNLAVCLAEGKIKEAKDLCEKNPSLEAKVALWGLAHSQRGRTAMESGMEGFALGEKHKLDRGLVVLGTLGNNAPFIGLFGTVIGIIQAFHELSFNPEGGPSVVMSSISEALVATAVGLLVAIPAVIAFNAFSRMVKTRMANVQSLIKLILSYQVD